MSGAVPYLVSEHMLLEVMGLHKLHAALAADVWAHVAVLHHVVLQLAGVLEGLVALGAVVGDWPAVPGQVTLQLGQRGEVQAALHAHVLPPALVLGAVGTQLAGVGKATSAHVAAVRLDGAVLEHVALEVAGLCEGPLAHLALVRACALVREQVCVQVAQLLEELAAQRASVGLDPSMAQYMRHQVVLGGVRLVAHAALPAPLPVAHLHQVALVDVDRGALHGHQPPSAAGTLLLATLKPEGLARVQGAWGQVHEWARQVEREGEHTWGERRQVWRGGEGKPGQEEGRGRPQRHGFDHLLFHLHRCVVPGQGTLQVQPAQVHHLQGEYGCGAGREQGGQAQGSRQVREVNGLGAAGLPLFGSRPVGRRGGVLLVHSESCCAPLGDADEKFV